MIIRRMNKNDIDAVCEIENRCFTTPWSRESIEKACSCPDNIYIVAQDCEKIIGFAGFWTSYETADLCDIVVLEQYRNRHIAYEMLNEGIKMCIEKNVTKIMLEVRSSNMSAIRLYEKTGFNNIGIRKEYYSKPKEDAIIMEKYI